MAEKLNLTKEEGRMLVWGDLEGFKTIRDTIVETRRWSTTNEIIVQRVSDGKFFRDNYSVGSTEQQDEGPYDYSGPDFVEVVPVEVKVIEYKVVE